MRLLACCFVLGCSAISHAQLIDLQKLATMEKLPVEKCDEGSSTTLWKGGELPRFPMHDGPEGTASFALRDRQGKPIGTKTLPGGGRCFGYVAELHAYVIASLHEIGSIVPIATLALYAEDGTLRETAFGRGDYFAYALVASASHRRLAFVGQNNDTKLGLYVLDLVSDQIRRIGDPIAPPPYEIERRGRWSFGPEGMDGYVDIEPDVMRFDGETLRVSYGADTHRARARKRTMKTWPLGK